MINNITINNTNTIILTSPLGVAYTAISLMFCNTSINSETVTVYAVQNGNSVNDLTTILKDIQLNAADTFILSEKILLDSLDQIVAIGSNGNRVSCTVSFITM